MAGQRGRPRDGFLRLHDIYQMHLNADLVVLSTDPTVDLDGCEVVATMAGGRWVHNPPPWD